MSPAIDPPKSHAQPRVSLQAWPLLPLPIEPPSASVLRLLSSRDCMLSSIAPQHCIFARLRDPAHSQLSTSLTRLRHRLSDYIPAPATCVDTLMTTEEREAKIYHQWLSTAPLNVRLADIKELNAMSGAGGELRDSLIHLVSQDGQVCLPMVDWRIAQERLAAIPGLLEVGDLGQGLLAAVRVLALVNNAHAFTDGNGRLGRFLFNLCLHRAGMPVDSYVPLKSIAALSRGGYEIRLREVMFHGQWNGFIRYHCQLLELIHELGPIASSLIGASRRYAHVQ